MNVVKIHFKRNAFVCLVLVIFMYLVCCLLNMVEIKRSRTAFSLTLTPRDTENWDSSTIRSNYGNVHLYDKNNDSQQVSRVYDWWRDFQYKAFKGEHEPDDILVATPPSYLPNFKNPCFFVNDPTNGKIVLSQAGHERVSMKCLPYFHIIGVDKSGTTDLWMRMMNHKHIVPNSGILGKETHWWSWRRFGFDIWTRGVPIRHFNWYVDHFDRAAKYIMETTEVRNNATYHPVITGEGSPTVFWDFTGWAMMPQNAMKPPEEALLTPHCIHHLTPNAKLILILRNPVDRMFSEYLFLDRFKSHHNISAELFHEGVQRSISMYQNCVQFHQSRAACLYDKMLHTDLPVRIIVGMYSVWLKEWLKVFPRQQILIFRNEDYSADVSSHLAKVFSFLELSPLSPTELQAAANVSRAFQRSPSEKAVGDMLPETRKILLDFYKPFNEELVAILGDSRFLWM